MPALLLFGDTERSPALRHEIPLAVMDPLMFCELDGRTIILTSDLERARIQRALPDAEVLDWFDFGMKELRQSGLSYEAAEREVAVRVAHRIGVRDASVPPDFPVALADQLRAEGVELSVDGPAFETRRRSKTGAELEGVRAAQRAAQAGMAAAAEMLARAEPGADGRLFLDGSELHCEHVRAAIRSACREHGAHCPPDVVVASVWNGFGHEPGSGPLPAGLPVQVDLWPQDERSTCWADMTRTFVVGEPSSEHAELIAEQERLVHAAHEHAIAAVHPGVAGKALYEATCESFEAAGYRTQRTGPGDDPRRDSSSRWGTASACRSTRRRRSAWPESR